MCWQWPTFSNMQQYFSAIFKLWFWLQYMKYAEELSLYITINFTAMKSRLLSMWNMITCHNETNVQYIDCPYLSLAISTENAEK